MSRNNYLSAFSSCLVWVIMVVIVGVIGISAYTWFTTNTTVPLAPSPGVPKPTAIQDVTYPAVGGGPFANLTQAQTVNQLTLLVGNARQELGQNLGFAEQPEALYFVTDFCLQTPDQNDWLLGPLTLQIQGQTLAGHSTTYLGWLTTAGWLEAKDPAVATQTHLQRCGTIAVPLPTAANGATFTLEIQQLETSMPAVPDCTRAEQRLATQNAGIQIKCQVDDAGLSYAILQKPEGMSETEVAQRVREAFVEVALGPWVFVGTLAP